MSKKIALNTLQEKYDHGLKLSDAEVIAGFQFFIDISNRAIHAGPEFKILFHQALKTAQGLENYGQARKLDMYAGQPELKLDTDKINLKTVYKRYYDADPLKDKEIIVGYNFFNDLANKLIKAGPTYKHFFIEAVTLAQRLEDIGQARKLNLNIAIPNTKTEISTPTI